MVANNPTTVISQLMNPTVLQVQQHQTYFTTLNIILNPIIYPPGRDVHLVPVGRERADRFERFRRRPDLLRRVG